MRLLETLRQDAARQHHFAGRQVDAAGTGQMLKVLLAPRFAPVFLFRLASWCAGHHLRIPGKLLSMLNFLFFGIEIGLDCEIGPGLFFPHTSGTVLGARRIGRNAVIYHNVTIGAKKPDLAFDPSLRPEVGNDAFLGAGAKILGSITLGNDVVVAANAVVLHSVPDGCTVAGVPAVPIARTPGKARSS